MSTNVGLLWPQTHSLWAAGTMYFENLLSSALLAAELGERLTVLAAEGSVSGSMFSKRSEVDVATYTPVRAGSRLSATIRSARGRMGVPDPGLARAIRLSGVDVVFGDTNCVARYSVPWVGWIPDFQHAEAPEYFSETERADRDRVFGRIAQEASLVLLSSENARTHFERFSPEKSQKARVAPFVSLIDDAVFDADPQAVSVAYGIDGPFVLVPNQWWRHKNHEVAIMAAALLRDRGTALTWVFTGALADYRDPSHISSLLQLIARLGLSRSAVVLGMLPRDEQLQLMRGAEMVVQPSLFEGWSTVVEDARTLGQRIVASNLDVHIEQAPPATLFFDARSPDDLAAKVEQMLGGAFERPEELAARDASLDRSRIFGRRFLDICAEATRVR